VLVAADVGIADGGVLVVAGAAAGADGEVAADEVRANAVRAGFVEAHVDGGGEGDDGGEKCQWELHFEARGRVQVEPWKRSVRACEMFTDV
jgi:hypothetical protein